MRSIKLSELGAQPKYQAFVQRFMQAAHIECEPSECIVDVLDEAGYLLAHHDASGDMCITSAGKELSYLADYTSTFDDSADDQELQLKMFSALHNALIEAHSKGFAQFTTEQGNIMTLCRFKD